MKNETTRVLTPQTQSTPQQPNHQSKLLTSEATNKRNKLENYFSLSTQLGNGLTYSVCGREDKAGPYIYIYKHIGRHAYV